MVITFRGTEGNVDVTFEPDDPVFAKGVFDAIKRLHKLQKELVQKAGKKTNGREFFNESTRVEKLMRETIDGALGTAVCEPLCGYYNVYGRTESGQYFWEAVMYGVADKLSVKDAIKRHWKGA